MVYHYDEDTKQHFNIITNFSLSTFPVLFNYIVAIATNAMQTGA